MDDINSGILLILGLSVIGGMLGALAFQKIRFPQVVGYIVIGFIIGESGFDIIGNKHAEALQMFNYFALGVIGFLVGGELKIEAFKKYGRQFTAILLGEGVMAFFLVGALSYLVIYLVAKDFRVALAGAVVFGAIASATDPASTVDVLWEYRAQGVMTTAIIAIVALDDALAMTLYGIGKASAQLLTGGHGSIGHELIGVSRELLGAIGVGGMAALLLIGFLRWIRHPERGVALAVGMIMMVIGVAVWWRMDVILAGMTLGFVMTNLASYRSEPIFKLLRGFSIPIYVLFFVLVGARLGFSRMTWWIWMLVLVYVIGRSVGKMLGSYWGASISRSPRNVRRYLGMSLFAQGGVAVGLSIVAAQNLKNIMITPDVSLGDAIVFAVTGTTMIVQLVGPAMVKAAVRLAGEAGRNITEDDMMDMLHVRDAASMSPHMLKESDSLRSALMLFRDNDMFIYPVIDRAGHLTGMVSLEALKSVLLDRDTWEWLLVADVMDSVPARITPDQTLAAAEQQMSECRLDQLPVVAADNTKTPVGIIDRRMIKVKLQSELIRRRSEEEPHG